MKQFKRVLTVFMVAVTLVTVLPSCTNKDNTKMEDTKPADDNTNGADTNDGDTNQNP